LYATRALGPLIGGATYQAVGISGIYAVIAMNYLVCLALAARIGVHSETPTVAQSTRSGLAFLLAPREFVLDRRFLIIMGVTLVYNLWCWPFVGMVPVIGQKDFALTPVGALSACDGLGGTIGALAVGLLATPRTLFRFYYIGTLACLMLMLGLALNLTVAAAVAVLLAVGVAGAASSPSMRLSTTSLRRTCAVAPPACSPSLSAPRCLAIGRPACCLRGSARSRR